MQEREKVRRREVKKMWACGLWRLKGALRGWRLEAGKERRLEAEKIKIGWQQNKKIGS